MVSDLLGLGDCRSLVPKAHEGGSAPVCRSKADFECFEKGAVTGDLLDLTVSVAHPAAAIQQAKEVCYGAWACPMYFCGRVRSISGGAVPARVN